MTFQHAKVASLQGQQAKKSQPRHFFGDCANKEINHDESCKLETQCTSSSAQLLSFNKLTVKTKNGTNGSQRQIVNSISGNIFSGLTAIVGAANSGKTCVLSALSLRLNGEFMDVSGEIRLNVTHDQKSEGYRKQCLFAIQEDSLAPEATVIDTLNFFAQYRLPLLTLEERDLKVSKVIELLELSRVKDSFIGFEGCNDAITLSERKRLCVAIELLNNPAFLFVDYPSNGLTDELALAFLSCLRNICQSGACCGIVCTLYKPSHEMIQVFDGLIMLRQGSIVHQGRVTDICLSVSEREEIHHRSATESSAVVNKTNEQASTRHSDSRSTRKFSSRDEPPVLTEETLGHLREVTGEAKVKEFVLTNITSKLTAPSSRNHDVHSSGNSHNNSHTNSNEYRRSAYIAKQYSKAKSADAMKKKRNVWTRVFNRISRYLMDV